MQGSQPRNEAMRLQRHSMDDAIRRGDVDIRFPRCAAGGASVEQMADGEANIVYGMDAASRRCRQWRPGVAPPVGLPPRLRPRQCADPGTYQWRECFVAVLSRDFPSDHSPLELVFLPTRTVWRRTIPRWPLGTLSSSSLYASRSQPLPFGARYPFEALADIIHVAYAIMPEVLRSRAPPGSAAFAWEAHWLTGAKRCFGRRQRLSTPRRSRQNSGARGVFLDVDGSAHPQLDGERLSASVRSLHQPHMLADFAAELSNARSDEERHATKCKLSHPLEA